MIKSKKGFGGQYHYFKQIFETINPRNGYQRLLDSDHGHNKKNGQSITGMFGLVELYKLLRLGKNHGVEDSLRRHSYDLLLFKEYRCQSIEAK